MKKAFRTSVVAVAASVAMVAVGTMPAYAKAPTTAQYLANALHIKTAASPAISLGGSSFDANLLNAVATQYGKLDANNSASFNAYQSSSSGTGRTNVIADTFGIGFSDVPLNFAGQDTTDTTAYAQVPVALGGVAIIYHTGFNSTDTVTNAFGSASTPGTNVTIAGVSTPTAVTSNGQASGLTCAQLESAHHIAMDSATLAGIFAGTITSWTALAAQNPKLTVKVVTPIAAAVPAVGTPGVKGYKAGKPQKNALKPVNCLSNALLATPTISVVSRTAGSGTTFMFTDYLNQVSPAAFPVATSAQFGAATLTGSNSAAVTAAVKNNDGAIGYTEYSYAVANGLEAARLKNAAGIVNSLNAKNVVAAATQGLAAIVSGASGCAGKAFSLDGPTTYSAGSVNTACFSINNAPGANTYPIAGFSYAIVKKAQTNNNTALSIAKFLEFLVSSGSGASIDTTFGQNLAGSQYYVAMPKTVGTTAFNTLKLITLSDGTTSAVSASL